MNQPRWTRTNISASRICRVTLLVVCAFWCGANLEAADFYVNKTLDTNDIFCSPGPPEPPPFDCSLREAIMKSNVLAGKDTIHVPAGTYTLTKSGRDEDASVTGDLDITDEVEIIGSGAFGSTSQIARIDANSIDRVFHIHGDVRVDITGVQIQRGDALGNFFESGGGIFNEGGQVFLWDCLVSVNQAKDGGGVKSIGGGAFTTVVDSYFLANKATRNGGAINQQSGILLAVRSAFVSNYGDGNGGALFLDSPTVSLINVTLSGNRSGNPDGGGGLFEWESTTTIDSCTFSENTPYDLAPDPVSPGIVRVRNTIVDGACESPMVITEEGNVEGPGNTCGFENPGDYTGNLVGLLPLANWGSSIPSRPPFSGPESLAVENDWADPACQAVDQRGVTRPKDDDGDGFAVCDTGAVERISTDPNFIDGFESGDTEYWSSTVE